MMISSTMVDVDRLVPRPQRMAIEGALACLSHDRVAVVKEALGEEYSYRELRVVRALLLRPQPSLPAAPFDEGPHEIQEAGYERQVDAETGGDGGLGDARVATQLV